MARVTLKKEGTCKAIATVLSVLLCADMILTSVPVYGQTEGAEVIDVENTAMLQTGDGELSVSENETAEEQENGAEDYEGKNNQDVMLKR